MRKLAAILVLALLLVPVLAPPADVWGRGGFHHGFHRGGCCFFGGFALGLGLGALATAPLWYPAYAYPTYVYPAYPPPAVVAPAPTYPAPPTYWYYCQSPPGYYPYVPQCPGGWLTVVPPTQ